MIETFIALLAAHVFADYVFQPDWMVARKKHVGVLITHTAIVLALMMVATGRLDSVEILALAGVHLIIDAVKTHFLKDNLTSHLGDQAAHIASLLAVSIMAPNLWETGVWATTGTPILHLLLLGAGVIIATRAGSVAIEKLMRALANETSNEAGLPQGGKTIGYLERGLIFALVLGGQAGSIGFLIAAKSILRFGAVNEDRSASEYVIIGTLASFGWAIIASLLVIKLQSALPPLEIMAFQP